MYLTEWMKFQSQVLSKMLITLYRQTFIVEMHVEQRGSAFTLD